MPPDTVFIVEEEDSPGISETVYTGRFVASLQRADGSHEERSDLPLDEAIARGRECAGRVLVRTADEPVYYSAGSDHPDGVERWDPARRVERRRPAGEEWFERTGSDPPIAWDVRVLYAPGFTEEEQDWDGLVRAVAEPAGARAWKRDPSAPGDEEELEVARYRTAGEVPPTFEGFVPFTYRIDFEIRAPTADAAIDKALARCSEWPAWKTVASARPAIRRPAAPRRDAAGG